jgi:hypothetical protein
MNESGVTFYDLLRESTIVRGILALLSVIFVFALVFTGHEVPDWAMAIAFTVIGYFFGTSGITQMRLSNERLGVILQQISEIHAATVRDITALNAGKGSDHENTFS